jgi:hypothetical protein
MNARRFKSTAAKSTVLIGTMFALYSISAAAQSSATLDPRAPLRATLLPAMKVTASLSNPHAAPSWRLASTRPLPVTLMPTLTVTADIGAIAKSTVPTMTVYAPFDPEQIDQPIILAAVAMPDYVTFQLAE